ncbi:MAG TPA: hypothetical protein VIV58_16850 [Kofleriaceae bacterium]
MTAEPRQSFGAILTSDPLRDAVDVARLAPSSHNCQPWALCEVESNDTARTLATWLSEPWRAGERWLVLSIDRARALSALPSLATEMRLSCGMFLELLVASLDESGHAVRVVPCEGRPPIAGYPGSWHALAAIAISPGVPRFAAWRTCLVADRHTNRAPYQARSLGAAERAMLAAAASRVRDREDVSLELVTAPAAIRAAGTFVGRHASIDFADLQAWTETFQYIRFDTEPTADGFPITQLFGPLPTPVRTFLRIALSPPVMRVARHLGVPRVMAHELGKLVGSAPLLACVSVTSDSPHAELAAGGVAMDLWMRATAAGLALHPVSSVLQHAELRVPFQRLVAPRGRAVFFARVGFPTATFSPTPRRSLEPGDECSGWVLL